MAKSKTELEVGIPPHDIDAERSVLGALLIDSDAIVKIVEFLRSAHFYRNVHVSIYESILNLYEKREPADLITVPDELKRMNALEKTGGVAYLTELVNSVPTAANIEHYAKIIRDHAVRRSLIRAAAEISEIAHSNEEVEEMLDEAEQTLFTVSQDKVQQDFVPIGEVLEVTFERLDELSKTKGSIRGVPTGFKQMDRMLSGLQRDDLVILAARPSVGKSSLAINIAQHAATAHKKGNSFLFPRNGSRISNR